MTNEALYSGSHFPESRYANVRDIIDEETKVVFCSFPLPTTSDNKRREKHHIKQKDHVH